jgi:hypothetical protein
MEIDDMDEQPRGRRWDDVRTEIRAAVADAVLTMRLTLDRLDHEVLSLKTTVYGDPSRRIRGLAERMEAIESKIDTIIDQNEARLNQWKGIKTALVIVGAISSVPALQTLAKVFGLIP